MEKIIGKKLTTILATPASWKTEMDSRTKSKDDCRVTFPYEAQNSDEMTIKEGDTVTLISKDCTEVGWWEGELNSRRGVFPDNFVKLLPLDFGKEGNRPKKPSPPSTPVIKQGTGTTERKHELKKIPPERPEMLPNRTEEKERPEADRPGTLPPRRPELPVGLLTHTRGDGLKIDLAGSSIFGILDKDLLDRSNDTDLEGFDSVVWPSSQSLTSSSLSSPDVFNSPSPKEDKDEHIPLAHRGVDVLKKTSKTVTISQVSENKASLLLKLGTMAAAGGGPVPLSLAASSCLGTAGHRANSLSLFGMEGKPKMEPAASSQAAMEELRTQVREGKSIIENMKDQQKREIKQLLYELNAHVVRWVMWKVSELKEALQVVCFLPSGEDAR
uniref:SH3 domain-containing protein n=1 Tax=Saimiri boliviensis boliviensis TaxID=39432 RepID=A0A2K6SIR4_SAIBB